MRSLVLCTLLLGAASCSSKPVVRTFPDRPPAWHEHDDAPVTRAPKLKKYLKGTFLLKNDVFGKLDHWLAVGFDPMPAADVNALDEVPCSTWYCPRNHLEPMSPVEVAAGPPEGRPPRPPLRLVSGKNAGATPGFIAEDATGRRYIIKLDAKPFFNLQAGAEVVGTRLVHAAGWHVPATWVIDFHDDELIVDPDATIVRRLDRREVPLRDELPGMLAAAARGPDGRVRASASQWLEGEILGPFEYRGRRGDDPNDRIPHEQRRSLRASLIISAWLNNADAISHNSLDVLVTENGRRYVKHYLTDWATSFGSWSIHPKHPHIGAEPRWSFNRMGRALVSFGAWERDWQEERDAFYEEARRHPSVGVFESDGWDPGAFRTIGWVPAHKHMTGRDAYWAAKVITAFTDEQIEAAVAAGRYPPREAAYVERALRLRRDAIGRRYLARYAAVEQPTVEGERVCFTDLARARGYLPGGVRYEWRLADAGGRTLAEGRATPTAGARGCLAPGLRGPYAVLSVWTIGPRLRSKASHVHVRWRADERRWVVVGLDRDE